MFRQLKEVRKENRVGEGFIRRVWCFVHTVLQKKKEALESGKQQTENTLKEGNDILNEANRLADEINSIIDVSMW